MGRSRNDRRSEAIVGCSDIVRGMGGPLGDGWSESDDYSLIWSVADTLAETIVLRRSFETST